jgi:hypothetical protein
MVSFKFLNNRWPKLAILEQIKLIFFLFGMTLENENKIDMMIKDH